MAKSQRSRRPAARLRRFAAAMLLVSLSVPVFSSSFASSTAISNSSVGSPGARQLELPDLSELDADLRRTLQRQLATAQRAQEAEPRAPATTATAWAQLAATLGRYGFPTEARAAAELASASQPGELRWAYLLGVLSREAGDLHTAQASFERCLEHADYGALARLRLAAVLLDRGEASRARQLLLTPRASTSHDSQLVDAANPQARDLAAERLALLGRAALALGEPAEAVRALTDALELQPRATALYYPLALAHRELGQVDAARAALQRRGAGTVPLPDPLLGELAATDGSAHELVQRALGASATGGLEMAFELYGRALEREPGHLAALRGRAATAARLGRDQEALASTNALLELEPLNPGTHFNLADLLLRNGDRSAAERALRRALELSPGYGEARYNLALLLAERGAEREALEQFEHVAEDATQEDDTLRADSAERALRLLLRGSSPGELAPAARRRASALALLLVRTLVAAQGAAAAGSEKEPVPAWQRAFAAADLVGQLAGEGAGREALALVLQMDLPSAARAQLESRL